MRRLALATALSALALTLTACSDGQLPSTSDVGGALSSVASQASDAASSVASQATDALGSATAKPSQSLSKDASDTPTAEPTPTLTRTETATETATATATATATQTATATATVTNTPETPTPTSTPATAAHFRLDDESVGLGPGRAPGGRARLQPGDARSQPQPHQALGRRARQGRRLGPVAQRHLRAFVPGPELGRAAAAVLAGGVGKDQRRRQTALPARAAGPGHRTGHAWSPRRARPWPHCASRCSGSSTSPSPVPTATRSVRPRPPCSRQGPRSTVRWRRCRPAAAPTGTSLAPPLPRGDGAEREPRDARASPVSRPARRVRTSARSGPR